LPNRLEFPINYNGCLVVGAYWDKGNVTFWEFDCINDGKGCFEDWFRDGKLKDGDGILKKVELGGLGTF
jgi:hypothetical protein